MSNNVDITPGSGKTVATHEESGFQIQLMRPTHSDVERLTAAKIDILGTGDQTLVALASAKYVRLYKGYLFFPTAVTVTFKDGAAGTSLTGAMAIQAGSSMTFVYDGEPHLKSALGTALVINLSASVQVSGRLFYTQNA